MKKIKEILSCQLRIHDMKCHIPNDVESDRELV